jgi:hypothetical protein
MSVTVERIDPLQRKDRLLPFLQEHVNSGMDTAGYHWQFEQMPARAIFILGHEAGEPVCTQSFLPQPLMLARVPLASVKSEHSFLLGSHRGTPVFTDAYALGMKLAANEGYDVCWGFTPAVKVWRNKLGFQVFEDAVVECTALLGRPRLFTSISPKVFARNCRDVIRYVWASLRRKKRDNGGTFSEAWPSTDEIHTLHATAIDPECIHLNMDDAFISWRIHRNPNVSYQCFTLRGADNTLAAYAIVGRSKESGPLVFHLSDCVARTEADGVDLMSSIGNVLGGTGCTLRYFGNQFNVNCQRIERSMHLSYSTTRSVNAGMSFVLKETIPTRPLEQWCLNALWTQGFHR